MAIATNMLHRGFSGAIGDLIFRNYNGKTVVSLRPVYKNETNTEGRRQVRGRFRDATSYAGNAMENTKLKAYYTQKARQLKLPNAYTAAITDYLRKAKAGAVTRSTFAGKKGEIIKIRMSKSVFQINSIKAILCSHQGDVLQEENLTKSTSKKTFDLKLADDFPDYAFLKIISEELGSKEYTINASAFVRKLIS
jgi:hypothetical protein